MLVRLGIDVGGTKVNIGVLTENGQLIRRHKFTITAGMDYEALMAVTIGECTKLLAQCGLTMDNVLFMGMGMPGSVDQKNGVVLHAPNLHMVNAHCADAVEALCGIRPVLIQDSRAAAWGEKCLGGSVNSDLLVCISLGTGIGCGIVYKNKIFHGVLGTAGETGHIIVVPNGRPCACGQRGCMETYASGTGIARSAEEHPAFKDRHLTCEQVFMLAEEGDADAVHIIMGAVEALGLVLTAVINLLSPDRLVFTGGLSSQRELYVNPLIAFLRNHGYGLAVGEGLGIAVSSLGSDAPMLGAAMLDKAM